MKENIINASDKSDEKKVSIATSQANSFSFEQRKSYFKKKWRKEHIFLYVILFLILLASIVFPFVFDRPYFVGLAPLIACIEYGYQNNKMMIYVEKNLYE
ncbi:MAG: hypothetical protein ACI4Q8_07815 [Ruminococcus sp.]